MRSGMEMTNKKIMVVGIAGAVILAILAFAYSTLTNSKENNTVIYIPKQILTLQTSNELPRADATSICGRSLDQVKADAKFPVLTPTTLPEGYSLKSADYLPPDRVTLLYADGNVCGENAQKLKDGVIELVAGPLNTISDAKNGQEYVNKLVNWEKANATAFDFDGKHAVGYPAGVGTSKAIDENDKVVYTYQYDYPASIWVVDDFSGTVYRLMAYTPIENLATIARSLK